MPALISCITEQHNLPLLLVAVLVCVAGNLAAVFMLSRARQCVRVHRNLWLAIAGAVLGGTIWATHFLAMLAYSVPVSYQLLETGASILVAIAISCFATYVLLGTPSRWGVAVSGCLVGLAIATMHAIGLSAISNSAFIESRTDTLIGSWLAGGAFTLSAMLVAGGQITRSRLIVTALLLVSAVCSHHLISMSGLRIVPLHPGSQDSLTFIDRVGIAAAVCVVSSLLIATGVAALFVDRYLTDVKGLANATFEAVVLTRGGRSFTQTSTSYRWLADRSPSSSHFLSKTSLSRGKENKDLLHRLTERCRLMLLKGSSNTAVARHPSLGCVTFASAWRLPNASTTSPRTIR